MAFTIALGLAVLDLLGHCALAYFLPGPWWMQWYPDIFLPFIFIRSWRSHRLLPENDPVLQAHRGMHSLIFPLPIALTLLLAPSGVDLSFATYLVVHATAHQVWDCLTHTGVFQKNLLHPFFERSR